MGQAGSLPSSQNKLATFTGNNATPPNYDLPPIKFHHFTHGENIQISEDGFTATRRDSYCKGIVFSNRPIMIGERVCLRLVNVSKRWSGVIRIGFSAHDPSSMTMLPKFACPDLTSRPGYWAKALPERYAIQGNVIHYYVAGNGEVHFGLAGTDFGVFFSGIDTRRPLWAMIDLYGNCTTMELVDLYSNLNNFSGANSSSNGSTRAPSRNGGRIQAQQPPPQQPPVQQQQHYPQQQQPAPQNLPVHHPVPIQVILPPPAPVQHIPPPPAQPQQPLQVPHHPQPVQQPTYTLENQMSNLQLRTSVSNSSVSAAAAAIHSVDSSNLRHNSEVTFSPMTFHQNVGRHVRLDATATIGQRLEEEFAQGYVFSNSPIRLSERIVLKVLSTEEAYIGSIAFGLTNCDPASLDVQNLPEDSDLLLDRAEYWVVSKDVANCPAVGDELSFQINRDGSVEFSKNGNVPSVFMYVDTSLPLWAFWDVYGHTSKVKLIGSTTEPVRQRPKTGQTAGTASSPTASGSHSHSSAAPSSNHQPLSECSICFERAVDCVLYSCGHMCLCFDCAMQQWRGRGGGFCPMCRTVIRDVIKTYQS